MFEDLKRTLKNAEIPPPSGAWDQIANSLADDNQMDYLHRRLVDFTVAPPPAAWDMINERLASPEPVETTFSLNKFSQKKTFRFLAAAAITGLIVMSGLYLFNKSADKKQLISHIPKGGQNINGAEVPSSPLEDESANSAQQNELNISSALSSVGKVKKNDVREATRLLRNSIVRLTGFPMPTSEIAVVARPIRNEKGDIIQDSKVLSYPNARYIPVTGPNGQQTYISSKFKNLLLYLNRDNDVFETDGYFDKTFIESLVWRSKFNNWRDKILENSIIPSSTNFMDIVELKDLILKDKDNR